LHARHSSGALVKSWTYARNQKVSFHTGLRVFLIVFDVALRGGT
jgi:hypothetical protein